MDRKPDINYSKIEDLSELLSLLHKEKIPVNQYWIYISSYQERKARAKGVPRTGLFELTPLCNLDCKMCYVHLEKKQLNGRSLLSVSQWKEIILQAHTAGMMEATLTGGECLTYPGFDNLFLFMRSVGIKPSIKTNGVLLDKERIRFFKQYQPKSINVSLYGSSNAGYREVTGHSVFNAVYENLLQLKEADLPVSISITPSKYMFDDIDGIIELVKKLGYSYSVNVALFQPRKETGRTISDLSSGDYVEIIKKLNPQKKDNKRLDESDLPECSTSGNPSYGLRCGAGRSYFNVSWNGQLSSCDNLNGLRVSLLENSFYDAWRIVNNEAIHYPTPEECSNCVYDKVCLSCAAYRSIGMEKEHCNPEICERTRSLVKEGIFKL